MKIVGKVKEVQVLSVQERRKGFPGFSAQMEKGLWIGSERQGDLFAFLTEAMVNGEDVVVSIERRKK